jgi:hypothetical protein
MISVQMNKFNLQDVTLTSYGESCHLVGPYTLLPVVTSCITPASVSLEC